MPGPGGVVFEGSCSVEDALTTQGGSARTSFTRPFRKATVGHIHDLVSPSTIKVVAGGGHLAVMTCGEICAGMNAAIRAVVRMSMHLSCDVTFIHHGLMGLVEGGPNNFVTATLTSTLDIIGRGGSIINSFEDHDFFGPSERLKAAKNLVEAGLYRLVIIGGKEIMKVMNDFFQEWPKLLTELEDREMVPKDMITQTESLNLAVIAASVSNDMCGMETNLGADSAMHRIIDATDTLTTTSFNTRQAYVIEVIGKESGYLALAGCIAASGTMAFIPEWPPHGDWREELKAKIKEDLCNGLNKILCFIATGARDKDCRPIKASDVYDVIVKELHMKTVVTVLGQVQRGGSPSAQDRLLAARFGAEAVMALHIREDMDTPCAIGVVGNEIICTSLKDVVNRNTSLEASLKRGDFAQAVRLRGKIYQVLLGAYNKLHRLQPSPLLKIPELKSIPQIAIVGCGRYSVAQCIVTKSIVGYCASKGMRVLGIMNGFGGFLTKSVAYLTWEKVMKWDGNTTDCLRSSRELPETVGMDKVASAIKNLNICGLILLGSFYAFEGLHQMWKAQDQYKEFCIPMCMVPVTILNNIPGTDYTIGSDSACNENIAYCEKMKRVARSQVNTVFVVETMGHKCGYVTTITAICAGAEVAYIPNEHFNFETLLKDVENVKKKFVEDGMRLSLILHSENANDNYNSEFLHKLYSEEGKGIFVCRRETIGHVQIGVVPSPMDRILATLEGLMASGWLVDRIEDLIQPDGTIYSNLDSDKLVLVYRRHLHFTSIAKLSTDADFKEKLPTYMWWKKLRTLMRILSQKEEEGNYEVEATPFHVQSDEIFDAF